MQTYSIIYQEDGADYFDKKSFKAPDDRAAMIIAHPGICQGCGHFDKNNLSKKDLVQIKAIMAMTDPADEFSNLVDRAYWPGSDTLLEFWNQDTGEYFYCAGIDTIDDDDEEQEFGEDMFDDLSGEVSY